MSEWLETAIAAKDATSDMVLMFLEVGCREESLVTLVQSLPRNEFERLCNAVFEGQLTALAMPCREGQTDLYDDKRWPRSGHMPPELAKAATNGNVNCLKFFLAQMGGFIDTTDIRGQTLLSLAAEAGRLEAVTYLLSQGASPHVPDGRGRSALYWAAREGKSDVIEMLVDSGAELTMDDIQMASGHMEQSDLKKLFRLHYRCRQIRKRKEAGDKSLD
jgi:hypothetical protein